MPSPSGSLGHILQLWADGRIRLVMSPRILDEVKRSWQKRYWRDRFDERRAERALRLLDTLSESVDPSEPAPRIASR
ncbi:PIN domain-containing protein, partial [Microbacterium sp.]|uniref:PIN domain-containing protein n=1 Tax=Microbacterium sp. TaxID=51671 RepID=UPI00344C2255